MVNPNKVEGKLYKFLPKSELKDLNKTIDPNITGNVRRHMVICLGIVVGRPNHVKVMTITSKVKDDREYVPISPTRKKPYPIQLRLRNSWCYSDNGVAIQLTSLPLYSYLKIDEYYEVPIQMLEEVFDKYGNILSIPKKHHGGLGELKAHLRRRDRARELENQEGLFEAMNNLALNSEGQSLG
ncbi:hypothetical protein NHQ30_004859 [Ciborinia camelliae]|nr:hypothetical protein NHQ30_004859 [Ciborinia camelliae]